MILLVARLSFRTIDIKHLKLDNLKWQDNRIKQGEKRLEIVEGDEGDKAGAEESYVYTAERGGADPDCP